MATLPRPHFAHLWRPRPPAQARDRTLLLALIVLLLATAGCGERDKGDPVAISRDFIRAIWSGDLPRVESLSCEEWRTTTRQWAQDSGDPTISVDLDHAEFTVTGESDRQVEVRMSGVIVFESVTGQTETRDLAQSGDTLFILVDENGWKVCDVR